MLHSLSGLRYRGYEIHMGRSAQPALPVQCSGNVYGSYIHGIFDAEGIGDAIVKDLAANKGVELGQLSHFDPESYMQHQYDLLADTLRAGLDMDFIYRVVNREG